MKPWEKYQQEEEQGPWIKYQDEQPSVEPAQAQPPLDKRKQVLYRTSAQAANILNAMLMGVPEFVAQKEFGQKFVNEPDLALGDKPLGQVIGSLLPVGAIAQGTGKLVKGVGVGAKLLKGAIEGSAIGAALPPETSFTDLQARGKQAITGAILGAAAEGVVAGVTSGIKGIKNIVKQGKQEVALARHVRRSFLNVKRDAVEKFGSQLERLALENSDKTVSLSSIADDINSNIESYSPEFKNAVRKIPGVKFQEGRFLFKDDVSVKEVQDMINHINTKIPTNIKANHLDILDLNYDLKAAQLDAFPEMAEIRKEYANVMQPYNQVKNQFKFNRTLTAIQNNFGGAEGKKAVQDLFADNPKLLQRMGGYKKAMTTLKAGKDLLWALVKLSAVGAGVGAGGNWIAQSAKEYSK